MLAIFKYRAYIYMSIYIYIYARSIALTHRRKEKADNHDKRETKTREAHKAKSVASRESRIWGEC